MKMPYGYSQPVFDEVTDETLDEVSGDTLVSELVNVLTEGVP